MRKLTLLAGAVLTAMAFFSCDNDSLTDIGNSLTDEGDKLDLSSDVFSVETRTCIADSVLALSTNCYFGRVRDPETGADVTSEFTTQFHLLDNVYMSPEDKIVGRYENRGAADSCDIIIYLASPFMTSDSLQAMKMRVNELAEPMEEGQRYYSNYDPRAKGMLRPDGIRQGKMFTYENLNDKDSLRATTTYIDNIRITLNSPYTATDGTVYDNYGTYIMRNYYDHPEYFRSSYAFIHQLCPGFFFEITDGYGFYAKVTDIGLRVYYRVQTDTTVNNAQLTLAGTKEVLQTTHISNDSQAIANMAQESGHTYIKTPAGLFTELTIPVDDVKSNAHKSDSLVGAKLTLQRINNESFDDRQLGTPRTLLMVQKDSLKSFFESNKVPDNKTSFYTTLNSTYNYYSFQNISNLVTLLWEKKEQGLSTDANWTANHPDWNKMVLVPITYSTSSTSTSITNVQHDMSLNSIRLVGGTGNPAVQLSVVYAKFK